MSGSQKKQLLTFVQDIISVGIEKDFENGKVSNQQRVQFAIYAVALRRIHVFRPGKREGETRLASRYVTDAAVQYFGKPVKHQSAGEWKYQNGYYSGYSELFEQLEPEPIKRLRIFGAGASRLTAYVDYIDPMTSSDLHKDVVVKIRMTLKKISSSGKSRYLLISYKSLTPRT